MAVTIQGKIALVTGASSGIGRATALALARAGAHVVLASRRAAELEAVASEIRADGRRALVIPTDVEQQEEVTRLIDATLAEWERIDILVANAGLYVRAPAEEMTVEHFERSLAVNFYGTLYPILAALPHMLRRRSGHIVIMSSIDGRKAMPTDGPYAVSKAAQRGLGDALRQDLHGTGVRVTTVFPGRIDTPLIDYLKVPFVSPKIPPAVVADRVVRAIRHDHIEVVLPFSGRLLDLAGVLWPRFANWAVRVLHLQGWDQDPGGRTRGLQQKMEMNDGPRAGRP